MWIVQLALRRPYTFIVLALLLAIIGPLMVLRGRLEVTVGDQRRVLGPGDAYYFNSRLPHRFRTVGEEVCEVVSACTPPSF